MKRIGLVLASLAMVFAISGCGGKKLDCTMSEDGESMRYIFNFDRDDEIKTLTVEMTSKFDKDEEDEIDDQIKEAKERAKEEGYKLKVSKGKEKLTIKMTLDADQIEDVVGSSLNADYDTLKEQFDDSEFKCKK